MVVGGAIALWVLLVMLAWALCASVARADREAGTAALLPDPRELRVPDPQAWPPPVAVAPHSA